MIQRNITKTFTAGLMVILLIGGSAITVKHSHSAAHMYTDFQMASSTTLLSLYSK